MLHMLWFVARGHCIVMGTHWRHTLEASRLSCPRMSCLDAWISLDKDVHCSWVKGAGVLKMMFNPSKDHWCMTMSQSHKYCKPFWCSRFVQQFQVYMPLLHLLWLISRGEMMTTMEGNPLGPYNSLDRNYLFNL